MNNDESWKSLSNIVHLFSLRNPLQRRNDRVDSGRRLFLRRYRNPDPAIGPEDIAQTALLGMIEYSRASTSGQAAAPPMAVARRTLRCRAVDAFRRSRLRNHAPIDNAMSLPSHREVDPLHALLHRADQDVVQMALEKLDPDDRTIVLLHIVKGMPLIKIALKLNISRGKASVRLKAVKARLRRELSI